MASSLIITLGTAPAVLTESLWALHHVKNVRDLQRVAVITTTAGKSAALSILDDQLPAMYAEWGESWGGQAALRLTSDDIVVIETEDTTEGDLAEVGRLVLQRYFAVLTLDETLYAVAAGRPEMRDWLANAVALTDARDYKVRLFDAPRFRGRLDAESAYLKCNDFYYPTKTQPSDRVAPDFVGAAARLYLPKKFVFSSALVSEKDVGQMLSQLKNKNYDPNNIVQQHNLTQMEPDICIELIDSKGKRPAPQQNIFLISGNHRGDPYGVEHANMGAWLMILAAAADGGVADLGALKTLEIFKKVGRRYEDATGLPMGNKIVNQIDELMGLFRMDKEYRMVGYLGAVDEKIKGIANQFAIYRSKFSDKIFIRSVRNLIAPPTSGRGAAFDVAPYVREALGAGKIFVNGVPFAQWLADD